MHKWCKQTLTFFLCVVGFCQYVYSLECSSPRYGAVTAMHKLSAKDSDDGEEYCCIYEWQPEKKLKQENTTSLVELNQQYCGPFSTLDDVLNRDSEYQSILASTYGLSQFKNGSSEASPEKNKAKSQYYGEYCNQACTAYGPSANSTGMASRCCKATQFDNDDVDPKQLQEKQNYYGISTCRDPKNKIYYSFTSNEENVTCPSTESKAKSQEHVFDLPAGSLDPNKPYALTVYRAKDIFQYSLTVSVEDASGNSLLFVDQQKFADSLVDAQPVELFRRGGGGGRGGGRSFFGGTKSSGGSWGKKTVLKPTKNPAGFTKPLKSTSLQQGRKYASFSNKRSSVTFWKSSKIGNKQYSYGLGESTSRQKFIKPRSFLGGYSGSSRFTRNMFISFLLTRGLGRRPGYRSFDDDDDDWRNIEANCQQEAGFWHDDDDSDYFGSSNCNYANYGNLDPEKDALVSAYKLPCDYNLDVFMDNVLALNEEQAVTMTVSVNDIEIKPKSECLRHIEAESSDSEPYFVPEPLLLVSLQPTDTVDFTSAGTVTARVWYGIVLGVCSWLLSGAIAA